MTQESISITWHIDDVLSTDGSLTREEAMNILLDIKNNHDASIGVNWDVIEQYIIYFIKEKERE